jgi:hypothetical protein
MDTYIQGHTVMDGPRLLDAYLGPLLRSDIDPARAVLDRALERLNALVLASARMATVLLAVVDPAEGFVRYASAGHLPPLLVAPDGSATLLGEGRGAPLLAYRGNEGAGTFRLERAPRWGRSATSAAPSSCSTPTASSSGAGSRSTTSPCSPCGGTRCRTRGGCSGGR